MSYTSLRFEVHAAVGDYDSERGRSDRALWKEARAKIRAVAADPRYRDILLMTNMGDEDDED